ncbi:hypothetical protein [Legionella sp. km772]|uniref:hypothetical protein n=1 Tax=Legionella sp. km772 TaxID=2498111 RepID=UPI000F8EC463|nr:hypothetical protein [Legionella sp. km772]RUR08400.1 hypothetical protein ELY15_10970 [Legionella sp. km772]
MFIKIMVEGTSQVVLMQNDGDLSLKQVKEKVAQTLKLEGLDTIKIDFNPAKKGIVVESSIEDRTLEGDYGVNEDSTISVRVTIPLIAAETVNRQRAQNGLIQAISDAQKVGGHVIVTVGSCLQTQHGEDNKSLLQQQFPIEHLGEIDVRTPVHFIHIDPGFEQPVPQVKQLHELSGWQAVNVDNLIKIYDHNAKPYRITTIATAISNPQEMLTYFNAEGSSTSVLGVSLHEFALSARRNGTGLITGNFYASSAKPIIKILPLSPGELEGMRRVDLLEEKKTSSGITLAK